MLPLVEHIEAHLTLLSILITVHVVLEGVGGKAKGLCMDGNGMCNNLQRRLLSRS